MKAGCRCILPSNNTNETPALRYNNQTGEPIIPEGFVLRYDNQTGEAKLVKKRATRKKIETETVSDVVNSADTDETAAVPVFPNYTAPETGNATLYAQGAYAQPVPPISAPLQLYDNSRCAGFFRRLLAFAVDSLIAWLFTVLLSFLARILGFGALGFFTENVFFNFTAANVVGYLIITLYFVIFTKCIGATPGKMLLRIKVVSSELSPLSWWRIIYRETVGRYLSSLLLVGYLVLAVDPQHRGFHDMLADTRVIFE